MNDGRRAALKPLRSLLPVLVILALIAAVPLFSPSNRFLSLAISAGINVIALYGLSVLFGQTGILSMGHAALVGVGALGNDDLAAASRELGVLRQTGRRAVVDRDFAREGFSRTLDPDLQSTLLCAKAR